MKKQKSLFLLFMALVMMALSPQSVWAAGTKPTSGDGSSGNPYQIASEANLIWFRDAVNGTNTGTGTGVGICGKLTQNITLTSAWTSIGNSNKIYTGTFDGQGHTISGLNLTATAANAGFFGYVNGATIQNFTLAGSVSSNSDNVGSVVGYAKGSTTIQNIVSNVNITMTAVKSHLGGIAGNIENGTSVLGCTYSGTLNAGSSTDSNGGIVGFANANCSGTIKYCFFNGTVKTTGSGPQMGGILGYTNDESNNFGGVQNCYSCGTLTYSGSDTHVNAIVGRIRNRATTTINNTYLSGIATRACNTDGPSIPTSNTAITISVTANANGSVSKSYVNPTNTTATMLQVKATATTTGYYFTKWSDNNTAATRTIALMSNIDLTASFDNKYTITVKTNNNNYGTVSGGGTFDYNSSKTIKATPKTGHHFVQWNDGNTNASRTITVTTNATYTATFAPDQHTITISSNSNISNVTGGGTYDYGTSCTLTAIPNEHQFFEKWNDGNTDNPRTFTVTQDDSYAAIFDNKTYTISITSASPSGYGYVSGNQIGIYGSPAELVAYPSINHHFVEWNDHNTDNPRYVTILGNASYTATFAVDQHTITVNTSNSNFGTVSGNGTYDYNSEQTITATPKEHYHFVRWSDGDTNASRTVTVTENKTYTATFAIDQHTITVNTSNSDFGTVSGGGTFDYNSSKTIKATPKTGHHFVQWNDGNTNASRTITVTEDKTYTAEFAIDQFTISALANNNDFGTVSGGGTYDYNTIVALIAEPNEHYHFVRWNDGVIASTKYVTATSNSTYTATFAIDQHTIRVQTNNQNYGTVNGGGKYNYNSTQTITATPVPGGRFIKWDDEDTSNPRQIIVEGDATYTAIFDTPKEAKAVLENNTLTFYYDNIQHSGTTYGVGGTGTPGWIRTSRSNIIHVVFDESFAVVRPTSMSWWFSGCDKLTDITGWEYLNTEEVTNMSFVFSSCSVLSSIDLSHFNTEKVTTMSNMFHSCSSLASLDLSNFNTENVTEMRYMFSNCSSLASLDLSNFNTENVTEMNYMFASCSSLTSLDLSSFNTKNVTHMNFMFNGCGSSQALTLIIGNFDMRNVTEKDYMFSNNRYLKTLTLKSLPFLQEGTFDTQFSGVGKTVTYALDDNSVIYTGATNYLPAPTSTPTATYTREMSNEWGTVVVPFEIVYDSNNGNYKLYQFESLNVYNIYFSEYTTGDVIAAGTPMAVKAVGSRNAAGKYEIVLTGNGTISTEINPSGDPVNFYMNGTYTALSNRTDIHFIAQNQFWWADAPITIAPFRAWIEEGENPDTGDPDYVDPNPEEPGNPEPEDQEDSNEPQPEYAPTRLNIVVINNDEQIATWLGAINTTDAKATKVMIDGQMFILKNGQMFDICGRKIK